MPFPTSACCISVLNQQQQDTEHHNQAVDEDEVNQGGLAPTNCTVVENGLVVVRSLTTSL